MIVQMIVLDIRPIRMYSSGFKALITTLEPGYVMPSRKTIKNLVYYKHEQGNKQLIDLLSTTTSVSLTTDIWTSMANEAYITISAHWISPSWEVISCVLDTKEFPDSHTGVAIPEKILETMEAYNIKDKVSTIVHTIVHTNMQLSLRILHESDDIESLCCNDLRALYLYLTPFSCSCHLLVVYRFK